MKQDGVGSSSLSPKLRTFGRSPAKRSSCAPTASRREEDSTLSRRKTDSRSLPREQSARSSFFAMSASCRAATRDRLTGDGASKGYPGDAGEPLADPRLHFHDFHIQPAAALAFASGR